MSEEKRRQLAYDALDQLESTLETVCQHNQRMLESMGYQPQSDPRPLPPPVVVPNTEENMGLVPPKLPQTPLPKWKTDELAKSSRMYDLFYHGRRAGVTMEQLKLLDDVDYMEDWVEMQLVKYRWKMRNRRIKLLVVSVALSVVVLIFFLWLAPAVENALIAWIIAQPLFVLIWGLLWAHDYI